MLAILYSIQELPSQQLVRAVLTHDWAEQWTGDVPAPAKWQSNELDEAMNDAGDAFLGHNGIVRAHNLLGPEDGWLLDWLDIIELCAFCQIEFLMGNQLIKPIWSRGVIRAAEMMDGFIFKNLDTKLQVRMTYITDQLAVAI